MEKIVGPVDFAEDRNMVTGAATYLLAIDCYQMRGMGVAPTPKKAICALRAASRSASFCARASAAPSVTMSLSRLP